MAQRKNPAAVALGKKGGKKGGPARAAALSPARRTEIARAAVQARWDKAKEGTDYIVLKRLKNENHLRVAAGEAHQAK